MSRTQRRRVLWGAAATAVALTLTLSVMNPAAAGVPSEWNRTAVVPAVAAATPTASPTAAPLRTFTSVGRPTISGKATVAQKLTATAGTWKPAASVTFRWHLDGKPVARATKSSWRVPASALGKRVTVVVTGTRSGYRTTEVASAATAAVSAAVVTPGTPTVQGTPSVGSTLTAMPGAWEPATVALGYQWLRAGRAISGATASTYRLGAPDRSQLISVRITATKPGYVTLARTSASVRVGMPFATAPTPTLKGAPAVGRTLVATVGAWGPAPVALRVQWYRGSTAISGATTSRYTLVAADAGKKVSVRVTGTKSGYTSLTRSSESRTVAKVLAVPRSVSTSGTPTVGSLLTAEGGSWGPAPVALTYRWLRNGVAISGATDRSYRLVDADAKQKISVRVKGKRSGYTTVTRTSPTVTVKWTFGASPTPGITGVAKAGSLLSVAPGAWKPTPKLNVQWRVDGSAVTGATGTTWEVPTWAAGRQVTVSVKATKSGYVTVTRTSSAREVSWSLGSAITPGASLRSGVYLSSPNGAYRFGLLGDGNVALLKGTQPIRSARTTGTLDGTVQLTGDGELLLFDSSNVTIWSTRTAGQGATALTLDNSGTLSLAGADGSTVWSSDAMASFAEPTAAGVRTPGRHGWAYPLRPNGRFTTYAGHSGDDIAAPRGTPVYAMRGGTVKVREIWITSGCPSWAPNRSRQKEVVITSTIDGTRFEQVYAHLDSFSVTTGQKVGAGQRIGAVGSTGCSTGPHLHTAFTVDGVRYAMFPRDVLGVDSY